MTNFYCDIWEQRSHILVPLTKLTAETIMLKGPNKKKHQIWWEKEHQDLLKEAKRMVIEEAELVFLDFTQPFHLYSDANNRQLGVTLVQEGKPLGFYTRKLNITQLNKIKFILFIILARVSDLNVTRTKPL